MGNNPKLGLVNVGVHTEGQILSIHCQDIERKPKFSQNDRVNPE